MTDAAAVPGASGERRVEKSSKRGKEYRAIAVISLAHFVNHFHNLVLPPLFPFLKAQLGIGFVELGFALTVANILSVVARNCRSGTSSTALARGGCWCSASSPARWLSSASAFHPPIRGCCWRWRC